MRERLVVNRRFKKLSFGIASEEAQQNYGDGISNTEFVFPPALYSTRPD